MGEPEGGQPPETDSPVDPEPGLTPSTAGTPAGAGPTAGAEPAAGPGPVAQAAGTMKALFDTAGDAIVRTDREQRVASWNQAAERLYGITAAEALGQPIDQLLESTVLARGLSRADLLREVIDLGSWLGRVRDRPRIGSLEGSEIIVETALSVVRDAHAGPVGVVDVSRDVTLVARLERRIDGLTTLGRYPLDGGLHPKVAEAALDILCETVVADYGLIVTVDDDRYRVEAARNVPRPVLDSVLALDPARTPLLAMLTEPGSLVNGPLETAPMFDRTRRLLLDAGLRWVSIAALRGAGGPFGLVGLGWPVPPATRPSDTLLVQIAARIAVALENARLLEEVASGLAKEQRLAARLEALIGLTRLPVDAADESTLARSLVDQLRTALGARAGLMMQLEGETSPRITADAGVDAGLRAALEDLPIAESLTFGRFRAGGSAFVELFPHGPARKDIVEAAARAGYVAWAAFPIREDGQLTDYVLLYFDEPADWTSVDSRTLDAISSVVSIAVANFRLREGLVVSEDRYRTLFEESPEAYLVLDEAGRIVAANAAASRLYRVSDGTLNGRDLGDFHEISNGRQHGGSRADSATAGGKEIERLLAPGGRGTMHGAGLRSDGSRFPDEVFLSRVAIGDDRRVLVRVHDLTEQERLQQELVQAQKMEAIGMLVSGVAHELNNPLAAIIGYSTLLRRDERLPDEMRHDAEILLQEADRTRRIVQNLLDFARQRSPERHPTAVRALVASTLQLQSYSIGAGQIDVREDVPTTLPTVDVDRAQMQQVLLNLTQNAIQAIRGTGKPGTIDVTAEAGSGRDGQAVVRLRITDSGPGVEPALRPQLFLPFFTTKAPGEGTGLGLSVSFGIVAAHGGRLWFEPSPNDRGASFVLELPVEGGSVAAAPVVPSPIAVTPSPDIAIAAPSIGTAIPPPSPSPSPAPSRDAGAAAADEESDHRLRILVLDDEPSILAFLGKALAFAGYGAIIASSGPEALAAIRRSPVAAVLCDHRMSGMNGTEAYQQITAIRPELRDRFVFMSGDVLNPHLVDFARQRGIRLLPKPFDLDTVGRTLREVLGDGGAPNRA